MKITAGFATYTVKVEHLSANSYFFSAFHARQLGQDGRAAGGGSSDV
jgi:hypothetical protein